MLKRTWFLLLLCFLNPISLLANENQSKLGLPMPQQSQANSEQIRLGKLLFFDKRFSSDGSISCASCHQPKLAFSDGRKLAIGIGNKIGSRNTPSLLNVAYNTSQFWDGRRSSLEDQALDPILNPREHGLLDVNILLNKIKKNPDYVRRFQLAFQISTTQIKTIHIASALASYERTLTVGNSPFDQYLFGKSSNSLSESAIRGLNLFRGTAQCASCHEIGQKYALFTDNQFHSLSVGLQRIEKKLPELTTKLVELRAKNISLDNAVLSDEDLAELGRFSVTLKPADIGQFKTPSLRNVALTAPYMHDGSVPTLEEAVEFEIYYRSAETGRPLILTPAEKSDLVEFLKSLTSPHSGTNQ